MSWITWLRGLWLLRYPELVRALGDLRLSILELEKIRSCYPGVRIHADVLIQGWSKGQMNLASGVSIGKGTILSLGDEFDGYGTLAIGADTWIGQYNNLRMSKGANISIGKGCLISQFCSLIASNHTMDRSTPIQESPSDSSRTGINVGDDVWLGVGVTILPGSMLGEGVVIGANSVVNTFIPPYEIWAGSPARKIGERK